MDLHIHRAAVWLTLIACAALSACGRPWAAGGADLEPPRFSRLARTEPQETFMGRRWREAGQKALLEAVPASLPLAEQGALLPYETEALGFAFEATAGQVLEVNVACRAVGDPIDSRPRVYVDVFRVEPSAFGEVLTRLDDASLEGTALKLTIPVSAEHVVRIQAAPLTSILYALTLELGASLPFPVADHGVAAVRGFFGDNRDAGRRRHTGIDIFADRLTPVVAVAHGRAVPTRDNLGGNVVWLNTAGVSYYYAHLAHFAIGSAKRVAPGDVLGYVGNTGNAARTPPHLHFAVYRWGHGAIDPLPRLMDRRFASDERLTPPLPHRRAPAPALVSDPPSRSPADRVLVGPESGATAWTLAGGRESLAIGTAQGHALERRFLSTRLVPVSSDLEIAAGCAAEPNTGPGDIVSLSGSGIGSPPA